MFIDNNDNGDFMPSDFPADDWHVDIFLKEYLDLARHAWTRARCLALDAGLEAVARYVSHKLDRRERLPPALEMPVGRYVLVATFTVEGRTVIVKIYAFEPTSAPWGSKLSLGEVLYDASIRRARYVVSWRGGGFVLEPRGLLPERLRQPATPEALAIAANLATATFPISPPEPGSVEAPGTVHDILAVLDVYREYCGNGVETHILLPDGWKKLKQTIPFIDELLIWAQELHGDAGATPLTRSSAHAAGLTTTTAAEHLLGSSSRASLHAAVSWSAAPASGAPTALPQSAPLILPVGSACAGSSAHYLCGRADVAGSSASARILGRNIPEVDDEVDGKVAVVFYAGHGIGDPSLAGVAAEVRH